MPVYRRQAAALMKMQTLKHSLSRSEQQVVDYIINHPETVIYLSVAGLASNSAVSDATVVRTCKKLGYNGYQDLKVTLAQDLVMPLQSVLEEIIEGDSTSDIINKVFQGILHTINFTHDTMKIADIEETVDALINARAIFVIGLGNSHSIATDLSHKLMRLGFLSYAYTDNHWQTLSAASQVTADDVVFAISHSGSSVDIVDTVNVAKANGAKTISLTNIGLSPLCKITDIQLYTASNETKVSLLGLSSRIAQMAMIDVLYTLLAVRKPGATEKFQKVDKALMKKKY